MKIGFFGNANNYPFMLARAVRRLGHEVLFIVNANPTSKYEILDRPEKRYDDITIPYPDWIYDATPFNVWQFPSISLKRTRIIRLLQTCDAVILNQYGPSLAPDIRRPAIVLLTGTDLEIWASLQYPELLLNYILEKPYILLSPMNMLKPLSRKRFFKRFFLAILKRFFFKLVLAQRAGIRSAVAVSYFAKGLVPKGDALLDEIGVKDSQRVYFLMTDLEKIRLQPMPNNRLPRVFCVARLTWKKPENLAVDSELNYKGSDIMVRGLGLFARTTGIRLDIRLVKKGAHVHETMQLVKEEDIDGQVTWLEEMTQQDVLEECKQADIIIDQLGMSMVGMGGLDAMAMGRPLIANGRPEIMQKGIGASSPICQASTPEEVCAQLQRLTADPNERQRVGLASHRYVKEHFSTDRAAQICLDYLKCV
jgi:glycosyltransferase involved in cell wall biosynthesis